MADQEHRLALLEEGLYFQEKYLKELDEVLQAQQKHIDMLEKQLARTQEKLDNLLAEQGGQGFANPVPPHSVKW